LERETLITTCSLDDFINPKTGKNIFGCANIFDHCFSGIIKIQLVKELKREKTYPENTEIICQAHNWLAMFSVEG